MQYTAHQFRHRFATALYRATGDVRLVQQALGHKSIETTMVYVRVAGCDLVDAVAKLDF